MNGFEALEALREELYEKEQIPGKYMLLPEGSHKKRLTEDFIEQTSMVMEVLK